MTLSNHILIGDCTLTYAGRGQNSDHHYRHHHCDPSALNNRERPLIAVFLQELHSAKQTGEIFRTTGRKYRGC